jgi:hypothetical protein
VKGGPDDSFLDNSFGRDAAIDFAGERGMRPAELEQSCSGKVNRWDFTAKIKSGIYERVVAGRVKDKTPRPYFGLYLRLHGIDESEFTDAEKKLFRELTGKQSFRDIDIPDEMQALFHFLLVSNDGYRRTLDDNIPDLISVTEDMLDEDEEVFMEYAGLDTEGYRGLWLECARQALDGILKPGKKGGKGKARGKKGGADNGGEPAGEDNYPFEADA